ncbi:hypothetical protein [Metabacillus fastidiosus]|uniref:hypothetical protein n=1 Tax=Metabacillus fastidiosus TaxID=1458 RepID=UPI003D2A8F2E
MAKTWIIGNTQLNNTNIILYENRPFATKEEMNEAIIRLWNETVAPEDTIYHLGNVIHGSKVIQEELLKQLNGYKILRVSNYDNRTTINHWKNYFDEVYTDDILLDDLCLSHDPLNDYEMERLLALGLIKGSVHGHNDKKSPALDPKKYFCVSSELTNYRPIDFDVIKEYFRVI